MIQVTKGRVRNNIEFLRQFQDYESCVVLLFPISNAHYLLKIVTFIVGDQRSHIVVMFCCLRPHPWPSNLSSIIEGPRPLFYSITIMKALKLIHGVQYFFKILIFPCGVLRPRSWPLWKRSLER